MNKIDPELLQSIPLARDVLREAIRKEQRMKVKKAKKVNIFDLKSEEPENSEHLDDSKETDHDIFGSDDLPDGMMYIRTADGRKI